MITKPSQVILPLAVLLATAPSLLGQQFYGNGGASASVTPGTPSSDSINSSFPVTGIPPDDGFHPGSTSGSASFTANGVSAVGSATGTYAVASGWSSISVSSTVSFDYPATPPNSELGNIFGYGASASSGVVGYIYVYDVIISGPSVATLGSVNLSFSGDTEASASGGNSYSSYSSFGFSVTLNGASQFSGSFSGNLYEDHSGYSDGSGLLTGYAGGTASLTTGEWIIPTGVPLTLYFSLSGSSSASGDYDSNGDASNDGNLWLPLATPLFNLPEGFTANSADGAIVNNYYTAVPEPEHYFALAGAGLAVFGLYRRARRR